jgi:hypothetical protein
MGEVHFVYLLSCEKVPNLQFLNSKFESKYTPGTSQVQSDFKSATYKINIEEIAFMRSLLLMCGCCYSRKRMSLDRLQMVPVEIAFWK